MCSFAKRGEVALGSALMLRTLCGVACVSS